MRNNDLELFKTADEFQKRMGIRTFRASLGDINGRIDEPGQDGYVRVRISTASSLSDYITVLNKAAVNKIPGTAVIVGYDPDSGNLAVLRLDFTGLLAQGTNPTSSNPADPNNSKYITQDRLATFVCTPVSSVANSMLIAVQTGDVLDLDADTLTLFLGAQVDLTAYIPGSTGEWCLACIFWKTDNTLEVFASTPKTSPTDLGMDDINECLAARSSGSLPLWAWQLYNGQTGIAAGAPANGGDDFMDLRPLWFMLQTSGGGSGTVTSVALTAAPSSVFNVSGSPVTTAGTLDLSMDDQAANKVLAGPTTGADAAPAFRALVDDDIPAALTLVGGTINNTPIGASTPNTGAFTNLSTTTFEDFAEASTPSTPASDHARLWAADDNGYTVERWIDSTARSSQIFRDNIVTVQNNTGATIAANVPVFIGSGASGVPRIAKANPSAAATCANGITIDSATTGNYQRVLCFGILTGFDTSGAAAGSPYYLSTTAGALTTTAPVFATLPVYRQIVAYSLDSTASGTLFVCPQAPQSIQIPVQNLKFGLADNGSPTTIEFYSDSSKHVSLRASTLSGGNQNVDIPDLGSATTDTLAVLDKAQTFTNKTFTAPTIADFTNANHDHLDADDGGTLSAAAIASGTLSEARLPHKFAVIEEQQAQNTAGGGSTATTWTTRVLNTEVVDADGIVTISSNQFTPLSGTYRIYVVSPFVGSATTAGSVRIRLRNATATTVVLVSANHFVLTNQGCNATLQTEFTANGTDAYDIQYYITQSRVTNGLGAVINETSALERYTQVLLEKIA